MPGRELPVGALRARRLRGGAQRHLAVERRGHRLPRRPERRAARLPRPAALRQGRRGPAGGVPRHRGDRGRRGGRRRRPGASVEPVRAQRARPGERAHGLQARVAARAPGARGRSPRRGPGHPARPGRRLEHRSAGRGRVGHRAVPARGLHARLPGRARGVPRVRGRRAGGRGAPAPPRPRRVHVLGLHGPGLPQEEGHAHRLPAVLPALARTVTDAWIDREERKGKAPRTTRPWSSSWAEPRTSPR